LALLRLGQGGIALHKLFAEDFGWRSIAEAFAGRAVELVTDVVDLLRGEAFGVELTGEPASDVAVGVFNRAFLPGRLRVAKPGGGTEPDLKIGSGQKLQAPVKGDRAAGMGRQRRQADDQPVHHRS